jgi:hypothetical protein
MPHHAETYPLHTAFTFDVPGRFSYLVGRECVCRKFVNRGERGGRGEGGVREKEYEEIRFLLRQEKCKVLGASESRLLCLAMPSFTSYLSLLPYSLSCNPQTDRLHVSEGQIMNAHEGETRQY